MISDICGLENLSRDMVWVSVPPSHTIKSAGPFSWKERLDFPMNYEDDYILKVGYVPYLTTIWF